MAGKREMTTRDRQRTSKARKRTHKEGIARQKQQAEVLQRLLSQARAEHRAEQG